LASHLFNTAADSGDSGADAWQRFQQVRSTTLHLVGPLSEEDAMLQSMPDASPAKWHLAHTTWFFETFILADRLDGYRIFDPAYRLLFNSYYKSLGGHPLRQQRGLFSRPSFSNVLRYRRHVDEGISRLLAQSPTPEALELVELGINHEQQHQELLLTDILHAFWSQPLRPAYVAQERLHLVSSPAPAASHTNQQTWISHPGGTVEIGAKDEGFAYDNERPQHTVLLLPHRLALRLTTNAEYLEFIHDKGYERPELWLSDGWDIVCREGWQAPLYWEKIADGWSEFGLHGTNPLNPEAPVCHVSYFEADAFARWSNARLPLESEWEAAAQGRGGPPGKPAVGLLGHAIDGNLLESGAWEPRPAGASAAANPSETAGGEATKSEIQLFGDVWEWTASAYLAYPGFRPEAGAVGEYNGKFMCNQFVLRGGSFATPASHIRATYRNFFAPHARWQFTGIRLAKDETD